MRIGKTLTGITIATLMIAGSVHAQTNDPNEAVLQELRAIRQSLDTIAGELAKLREKETANRTATRFTRWESSDRQGSDLERLNAIKLPPNPDADQIKQYIQSICNASRGQNSFSSSDPQVDMLMDVGITNIQYLIEELGASRQNNDFHLNYAITELADESCKPLILEALPRQHALVNAITTLGWEQDAKPTLINVLSNNAEDLSTEWVKAIASLKAPETYPLLRDYFINGENQYWTYEAIKDLPITNMAEAVQEAWERSRYDDCNGEYMAQVAMEYGNLEALDAVINLLAGKDENNRWMIKQARAALLRHIDTRGSNEDLVAWYRANKDKLKFDTATSKFVSGK